MKHFVFSIFYLLFAIGSISAESRLDSLLIELDNTLLNEKEYTIQKEAYINKYKQQLDKQNINDENKYLIYQNLSKEYEAFVFDSAYLYSQKAIDIAQKLGNKNWLHQSKIQMARIQAKAGIFTRAIEILNAINSKELTKDQLIDYYYTYADSYIYWLEYQNGFDIQNLIEKRRNYQDSLLQAVETNTYEHAINYGTRYIEINDFKNAERVLFPYFSNVKPDTRNYAILTSIFAYFYEQKGDREQQKIYLAMSAIADIRASVKENTSLRTLAVLLFEEGDVKRANNYIKKSLDDANFYNARLRNIQTSRLLPIIDKAYQLDREYQQDKLRTLLIIVSLLSCILLVAIYFVVKQVRRLSKAKNEIEQINSRLSILNEDLKIANENQNHTNLSLAEANRIKEQFIGSFLEICTQYIDKLDAFKITVNRKIKAGQTNEILKMTSASEDSVRELKELYTNFDNAFLNIYPNFVEEFNKLLRQEERYAVNNEKILNQELRVFALIRLGITDSNKIATFLHYTLRTIYNYRSKVKSKVLNQEIDFEEAIRHISTPKS
ncbi:DUF6377 domain-containing protein [Dysgonomonas sp. ZJ279]|uniref:DUF6377 domain-containing protein n=1 Tax=Dysgonomonas sp. ZJ279 TaxID=2709796 RepID=UPI0013EA4CA3|nr:DUF6377 domain-containing protein [Dysgonomonas sp. ZJ279]